MNKHEYVNECNILIKRLSSQMKKDGTLELYDFYTEFRNKAEKKKFKAKRRRRLELKLQRKRNMRGLTP